MTSSSTTRVGVGVRASHYAEWLAPVTSPSAPFVEAISENFLGRGGRPRAVLEARRRDGDVFLHGVSMSIGSVDPLDETYLGQLRDLARSLEARFVSDHLCFGSYSGISGHDLWPLPLVAETMEHLVPRVLHVQERLGRRLALENVSSYLRCRDDVFEADFLRELAERTDCLLLVDVNNIVVSSKNHGFDPDRYLAAIPRERVAYLHVAGHSVRNGYRFDDHASAPDREVRALLRRAFELFGDVPCVFEWDENIPNLATYLEVAREISDEAS